MTTHGVMRSEIQDRVRRGYLERLDRRLHQMRLDLAQRDWTSLLENCQHVKNTAGGFDLHHLADLAKDLEELVESKLNEKSEMGESVETIAQRLFSTIDAVLIEKKIGRTI